MVDGNVLYEDAQGRYWSPLQAGAVERHCSTETGWGAQPRDKAMHDRRVPVFVKGPNAAGSGSPLYSPALATHTAKPLHLYFAVCRSALSGVDKS